MVKIDKTPLHGRLSAEKIRSHGYRSGEIFDLIVKDCRNKCYICEDKNLKNINVEHRVSHRENETLKYDWNNLFLRQPLKTLLWLPNFGSLGFFYNLSGEMLL